MNRKETAIKIGAVDCLKKIENLVKRKSRGKTVGARIAEEGS